MGKPVSLLAMAAIWSYWSWPPWKLLPVLCWKCPISLESCAPRRASQGRACRRASTHASSPRAAHHRACRRVSTHASSQSACTSAPGRTMLGLASDGGGGPPSLQSSQSVSHHSQNQPKSAARMLGHAALVGARLGRLQPADALPADMPHMSDKLKDAKAHERAALEGCALTRARAAPRSAAPGGPGATSPAGGQHAPQVTAGSCRRCLRGPTPFPTAHQAHRRAQS